MSLWEYLYVDASAEEDWDRDKDRAELRFDDAVVDTEDFPDNSAW